MILEAILIGGAIRTVSKMIDADKMETQAERINIRAFEKVSEAQEIVRKQNKITEMKLQKLVNRKRGIYKTSMQKFLELYRDLQKINFEEGEGIKELNQTMLTPVSINEIKQMTGVSRKELTDSEMFATYIFTGIGGLIKKDSEMNISVANIRSSQAEVIEKQSENICIALTAVGERAEKMSELLMNLNVLFMTSLSHTSKIVKKNGNNKNIYSLEDREALRTCFNIAKAIKDILDVPLLDKNGDITKKSLEMIIKGEEYLYEIKKITKY